MDDLHAHTNEPKNEKGASKRVIIDLSFQFGSLMLSTNSYLLK